MISPAQKLRHHESSLEGGHRRLFADSSYRPSDLVATVGTVRSAVATGSRTGSGHATQLVFAGELAAELAERGDQIFAYSNEGLLWGDVAVRLNADKEFRHVRMSDCVCGISLLSEAW